MSYAAAVLRAKSVARGACEGGEGGGERTAAMEELLKLHLQKMLPWQKMQYKVPIIGVVARSPRARCVQTYLRWVNHFLVNKDLPEITFLEEAVEDGIILMRILEHYSGKVRLRSHNG